MNSVRIQKPLRLLYYSPSSYGGLADYAHAQATALTEEGLEVTLLCSPNYLATRTPLYKTIPALQENTPPEGTLTRIAKALYFVRSILFNFSTLANVIEKNSFPNVLLGSYMEYLAPLWAYRLQKLAHKGTNFGAIVHDPVRDFVLGPMWWHRRSIAAGYSFLKEAFVHEATELDTVKLMPNLRISVIPHGPYQFPEPSESVLGARSRLQLPAEAKVVLAFGHVRTNKNLDLAIQAIAKIPNLYLVVAGKQLTGPDSLVGKYQKLAKDLGIADRCRWENRFISEKEVGNFFQLADLVLLTYDRTFRSASGVLNTAVSYRKPCLASAGIGPLHSIVQKYQLGIWVEPDSSEAIYEGLERWQHQAPVPDWTGFLEDNSWQQNAEIVISRFFESEQIENLRKSM